MALDIDMWFYPKVSSYYFSNFRMTGARATMHSRAQRVTIHAPRAEKDAESVTALVAKVLEGRGASVKKEL
jgi:hypothetical protein